jgi:hypothetical protein
LPGPGIGPAAEFRNRDHRRRLLGRATEEGESPVSEMVAAPWGENLSTVGHEKSCGKLGGPPSKAKYESATDSEEVP